MATSQNNLAGEKSPYLRQHLHDPVAWQPWNDASLTLARSTKSLIFLSIGYSTCHWCHVMARESFMDHNVAELLNAHFIPILVDCEERPDINQIYMKSCREMLAGYGGWPLNVVLTPEKTPIFAGVYMSKESSFGRKGFIETLTDISSEWQTNPSQLLSTGKKVIDKLLDQKSSKLSATELDNKTFKKALKKFYDEYDIKNGGFGPDPKFIQPSGLVFLLRRSWLEDNKELLSMVEKTLTTIARSGITDQIGGGVHRYATDLRWQVPHFEKMIYDQAGVILAYLESYQITGRRLYSDAAQELIKYVFRNMTNAEGLFWTSEDADIHGKEGRHFTWTKEEIYDELGDAQGEIFCKIYGVTAVGNFQRPQSGPGSNVLHMDRTLEEWSAQLKQDYHQLARQLQGNRYALFKRRLQRSEPEKDRQIITAWNGFMISALTRAGIVLENSTFLDAARQAAGCVQKKITDSGALHHNMQDGARQVKAFASDYVYYASALLDLYEVTAKTLFLADAIALAQELKRLFWDEKTGGLFETEETSLLIVRLKDIEERERPSTNSIALGLFTRLWLITGDHLWKDLASSLISAFTATINQSPGDFPWFLQGFSWHIEKTRKIVLVGNMHNGSTQAFKTVMRNTYSPNTLFLCRNTDNDDDSLTTVAPSLSEMKQVKGKVTVYVCDNFACHPPITKLSDLKELLRQRS